jgi:predicted transcriptional regulator
MRLTEAEWVVMNALWQEYPATAREIAGRLPAEVRWAYTTIKTLLTRLAEKKAVVESKQGNTSVYKPAITRHRARHSALRALADQAFDGAFGPLMHFLLEEGKLTAAQRRKLMELLGDHRKKKGESK